MLNDLIFLQFWFLISLLGFGLMYRHSPSIGRRFEGISKSIAKLGNWRGGLTGSLDEIPKFAFLRILFGGFLLNRAILLVYFAYPGDWQDPIILVSMFVPVVCSVLLIAGLMVQWTLIVLVVFQWQLGEFVLSSSTLGNDIAAMLSLLLFLSNAGSRISIDEYLMKRVPTRRKALLYFAINDDDIVTAKFLSLFCYWLVCVYSFFMHLSEEAWMQGFAGPQLLTNNFMSHYHSEFVWLFDVFPPSIYFFIFSMWIMLPWYVLLLPFVIFGGVTKAFVVGWGVLFFCLSTFFLNLGWLGEFEFLFWAALFLNPRHKLDLIYDDKCNLCDRTVNFVKRVDLLDTVRLKPVSQNLSWVAELDLTRDDVLRDLYGFDEKRGKLFAGYELYLALTRSVVLLMPLWPIFYLGKITRVGPVIYRFIADRRIKYFGICMLPTPKPTWSNSSENMVEMPRAVPVISAHVLTLAVFFIAAIPAPFTGYYGLTSYAARMAHTYGMTPINVFNRADLRMAENWFTLEESDGTRIPLFFEDGSRDEYHRSDRIYFGGTLRYRRWAVAQDGCLFSLPFAQGLLKNLTALHSDFAGYDGVYRYRQFHQAVANSELILDMKYEPGATEVVCEVEFPPS